MDETDRASERERRDNIFGRTPQLYPFHMMSLCICKLTQLKEVLIRSGSPIEIS